jgi:hypothetical protein
MWNSLPLEKGYGIYVLVLMKWVPDEPGALTGEYDWDYRLYCGSATKARVGIVSRLGEYDRGVGFATNVRDALHFGWKVARKCIIAWAPPVEDIRHFQLQALFLTLEATLSHAFAFHDHDYMKSMEKSFWDPAILDYQGLCLGSSLREIYNLKGFLELTEEELRVELDIVQVRKLVTKREWDREWRSRPGNLDIARARGRVYDAKRRADPVFREKKAEQDKAYAKTPRGKEVQKASTKRYLDKPGVREAKNRKEREARQRRKEAMQGA